MKHERLIGPKHLAGSDAKQKRVTNLSGGAGYSDFDRSFHVAIRHKHVFEQSRSGERNAPEHRRTPKAKRVAYFEFAATFWNPAVLRRFRVTGIQMSSLRVRQRYDRLLADVSHGIKQDHQFV
jgi:hypothetical protein